MLCALGLDPGRLPGWWQGEPARRHVGRWIRNRGLSDEAILAVAAETRIQNPEPPDGPKALDRAMARRAALDRFSVDGTTRRKRAAPAASETDQLAFFADWVNGERFLPPGAVSSAMAGRLIGSGRVTRERLAQRGVAC